MNALESAVPYLSVVIPAFNEANRLPGTLRTLLAYLQRCDYTSEVLVVDDGSTDETAAIAVPYHSEALPVRIMRYADNHGKGFCVREGVLQSGGRYVLFCDADGATSPEVLEQSWLAMHNGARGAIGSRHLPQSRILQHQPWTRRQMSRCFQWLANRVLVRPVTDVMCGFKLFEAQAARAIFSRLRLTRWAFDAELLFIAQTLGFTIVEIPVVWKNDPRSRARLWVDPWRSFIELMRIRWNAWRHRYD